MPARRRRRRTRSRCSSPTGPGKVRVPSVRNTPQERAIKDLDKVGLKVTADPQPSDTVKKGFAIGTSPRAGAEVDRGARVRLFVSSGPERITVPDVVGVTRETAESRITGLGLEVNVETEETDEARGRRGAAPDARGRHARPTAATR